jgi:predicted ferric reductase
MEINLAHMYWYLSRAGGFVAFGLLWLSMVYGLLMTNRMARVWPGGPAAFDLHQFTSLLALVFTGFHMLILLGDSYSGYTLSQLLLPFGSTNYEPLWVGIGQIGFYVMALVSITFYLRNRMKPGAWRVIHFLSFASFLMALGHGIFSGSDSGS